MSSCPVTANKKVALITGITGQDGSYLAEFLINKGYEVIMGAKEIAAGESIKIGLLIH